MWLGTPIGPTSAWSEVPTWHICCISRVVLPTAWMTSVIVPLARSKSAMVSGMRSPSACDMTMTNWPGLRGLRHQRVTDFQQERDVREVLSRHDLEPWSLYLVSGIVCARAPGAAADRLRHAGNLSAI